MAENPSIYWDEAKLNELIRDKIEENFNLEYKGAGALDRNDKAKSEITKDVSAMANSAGGVLIYGLAEFQDDERKHLPERIDPINRNDFSKEWLENIILQIQPRIPDLKIKSVQLASGSDHVAYVVEIPQGNTAHQANDCRYYRRFNFQSVKMPDNEVRDVMN
ncbi:MAG TPA: ATP-binding protein, partial [Verrucomicrobiae bacterium]|nr:ATP-binding protein [Verrucomicrobiae bacterium]